MQKMTNQNLPKDNRKDHQLDDKEDDSRLHVLYWVGGAEATLSEKLVYSLVLFLGPETEYLIENLFRREDVQLGEIQDNPRHLASYPGDVYRYEEKTSYHGHCIQKAPN